MKSSYEIIRRPIITEKATLASEVGGVVFEVAIKSTKAGKLNKYFILILRKLLPSRLSSTQDQKRPAYSKENIKIEKYSNILKNLL